MKYRTNCNKSKNKKGYKNGQQEKESIGWILSKLTRFFPEIQGENRLF
ncbi:MULTISPECIES: hypothetical protein [unclassified Acinetobacter]|nr:hypothetical protein [Acinetobacter sp. ANC 4218]